MCAVLNLTEYYSIILEKIVCFLEKDWLNLAFLKALKVAEL